MVAGSLKTWSEIMTQDAQSCHILLEDFYEL
jgi:hypothetical protein